MASNISRRLASLESTEAYTSQAFIWREIGQTPEQAIAARFPEGVPPDIRVTIIGWQESAAGLPQQVSIAAMKPLSGGEYGRHDPLH